MLSGNVGDFDKVMYHFTEFVKKPRNYVVSISMVVCRHTFKETPDFVQFGIKHGVDTVCLHQPLSGIKYPEGFDLTYSEEEWKYFDEAHRIANENHLSLSGFSKKGPTGEVEIPSIKLCRSPWNEVVIAPSGAVIPCFSSGYSVGNINTHSFAEIWDGEKINELRNAILAGENNVGNCNICVKYK
jgi:radical SAM protein with 4Fe4S-binding SPASM domain